jgi:hypothetical protein
MGSMLVAETTGADLVVAWATAIQAVVVVVAAVFAWRQLQHARHAREATERPFVVVDFEHATASRNLLNIVISNLGKSIARDVRFEFDPPLQSAAVKGENLAIFNRTIPTLVPGKRVSLFFDSMLERHRLGSAEHLPDTFVVAVSYRGDLPGSKAYVDNLILDLSVLEGSTYIEERTIHDVAKELKEVRKEMRKWTDGIRGLYVRTDDDRRREQEEFEEHRRLAELDKSSHDAGGDD